MADDAAHAMHVLEAIWRAVMCATLGWRPIAAWLRLVFKATGLRSRLPSVMPSGCPSNETADLYFLALLWLGPA